MYALSRRAIWLFGVATGAAIMTKALAGLLPVIILVLFWRKRFWLACGIAAAIAVPWHLYQLYAHPHWFWAEYVLGEHVTWGFNAPHQTTGESQLGFYAKRLLLLDPVLLVATIAAIRRSRLLLTWAGVLLVTSVAWQYRNAAYLLPLVPVMAIMAATAIPKRFAHPALAVAAGIFVLKVFMPQATWGIPFSPESVNPSHAALDAYAAKHRANELILVEPDDEFYSADLALPRVRYVYVDMRPERPKMPLDFEYLGITVTAAEFAKLDVRKYAPRLREFDLDSTAPVATVILARSAEEVGSLIDANPSRDFFVPPEFASPAHDRWQPSGARVFLLAREVVQRP
jgi:hypothetical protein